MELPKGRGTSRDGFRHGDRHQPRLRRNRVQQAPLSSSQGAETPPPKVVSDSEAALASTASPDSSLCTLDLMKNVESPDSNATEVLFSPQMSSSLPRITEEEDDTASSENLQSLYDRDWGMVPAPGENAGSDACARRARRPEVKSSCLASVLHKLCWCSSSPAPAAVGSGSNNKDMQDQREFLSGHVLQKLNRLEEQVNKMEDKLAESNNLMRVHFVKQFTEFRSQEERSRRQFTESFASVWEAQKKGIEGEISELLAAHGLRKSSGKAALEHPLAVSVMDLPKVQIIKPLHEYAREVAELLNSQMSADLAKQHNKIKEDMLKKLEAVSATVEESSRHKLNTASWNAQGEESDPKQPTDLKQPKQAAIHPLLSSSADFDFNHEPIPHEMTPEEGRRITQEGRLRRQDSRFGQSLESLIPREECVFAIHTPRLDQQLEPYTPTAEPYDESIIPSCFKPCTSGSEG